MGWRFNCCIVVVVACIQVVNTDVILCTSGAPIVNSENEIIGVIQVVNSLRDSGFVARDESLLNAFSAHIGITIASVTASDDDHRLEMKEALRLIKNQKKYLEYVLFFVCLFVCLNC